MRSSRVEALGWFVIFAACAADLASNVWFSLFTKVEHPLTVDFPYTAPPLAAGALLLAWGRRSAGWLAFGLFVLTIWIAFR